MICDKDITDKKLFSFSSDKILARTHVNMAFIAVLDLFSFILNRKFIHRLIE